MIQELFRLSGRTSLSRQNISVGRLDNDSLSTIHPFMEWNF